MSESMPRTFGFAKQMNEPRCVEAASRRQNRAVRVGVDLLEGRPLMAAILDLSTLSGLPLVSASALSSNGITAVAQTKTGSNYLVNTGTGAAQLTPIPTSASIEAVNNSGEVLFIENVGGTYPLASFLYSNGTVSPIIAPVDFLQGYSVAHQDPLQALETVADNINDSGVIVGYVVDQDGVDDGFKDEANSFTQISGSEASYLLNDIPLSITDSGVIYGYNEGESPGTNGAPAHIEAYAFSAYDQYTSTGILEVSFLYPQYQWSIAQGASSLGSYFVGDYDPTYNGYSTLVQSGFYTGPNGLVAVPSTHGGTVLFGNESSVNESGEAVGAELSGSSSYPFLFDGKTKTDLSALLPAKTPWKITGETGIGDNGAIVGSGVDNGIPTVYVLDNTTSATLQSVSFDGDGNYTISSDPNPTTGAIVDYAAPQYIDQMHEYPVLYVANSTLTASASWTLNSNTQIGGKILAVATGSGGIDIPPTVVTQSGNQLTMADTEATTAFPDGVKYFQHFVLTWQLSFDGGMTWANAGASDNPVYVTEDDPIPDPDSGKLFYTVVEQAVLHTIGDTSESNIVSGTWSAFTGLEVQRADGVVLTYYSNKDSLNINVESLLQYGDGECYAWAQLFLDALLINGIMEQNDYVYITVPTSGVAPAYGFLVQNWTFDGSGKGGRSDIYYQYVDVVNGKLSDTYKYNDYSNFLYMDVIRSPGVTIGHGMGQGMTDPASIFNNHQIDYIDGVYYDPSYGVTYSSITDFSAKSVAGFYQEASSVVETRLGIDLNGDGKLSNQPLPYGAYFIRKNTAPSASDFSVSYSTWGGSSSSFITAPSDAATSNAPQKLLQVLPSFSYSISLGSASATNNDYNIVNTNKSNFVNYFNSFFEIRNIDVLKTSIKIENPKKYPF
jgi:hypothetical protein